MTLVWRPGILYDADALAYMELVKAADTAAGQTGGLEQGVVDAINDFVVGCKTDGIWSAIKASCILAGARTLAGALIPLAGTPPTNNNFVSGDYNRKTGLVGDGSTKYLNSNRNNNADPQNSKHFTVWLSTAGTPSSATQSFGGLFVNNEGNTNMGMFNSQLFARNNSTNAAVNLGASTTTGLIGSSRSASSSYVFRAGGSNTTISEASVAPVSSPSMHIFGDNVGFPVRTNARLAFYSIGESLDLAKLDTRVSALITAIGAAIP